MALHDLPVIHQTPDFLRSRGQLFCSHDDVHGLGSSQLMTCRADTAETLYDNRDFPEGASNNKPLKPSEFYNVEPGLLYVIMIVSVNTDFAMPLNTAQGSISITFVFAMSCCSPVPLIRSDLKNPISHILLARKADQQRSP
jgi:hypothetical protein